MKSSPPFLTCDVVMVPGLLPSSLHSHEIKSGSGLGTRLHQVWNMTIWNPVQHEICYIMMCNKKWWPTVGSLYPHQTLSFIALKSYVAYMLDLICTINSLHVGEHLNGLPCGLTGKPKKLGVAFLYIYPEQHLLLALLALVATCTLSDRLHYPCVNILKKNV